MASDYKLCPDGRFLIKNFHEKRPFSNFLPGIAGLTGIPMWVFYVNRGQGVASFGTSNKDNAILEFFPANKAYQNVTTLGFRTFIKFRRHGALSCHELFQDVPAAHSEKTMEISAHELVLREVNKALGLEAAVRYFTVPGEPIAALARELKLTNLGPHEMELEVLDGLPQVNPYGMNEFFMKSMSRTIEAWMIVENLNKKAPYYRLKVDAADRPEVTAIEAGNFYFGWTDAAKGQVQALEPVVDPTVIFGPRLDFSYPKLFAEHARFDISKQITESRTPSAFGLAELRLGPGRSRVVRSLSGHAPTKEALNAFASRFMRADTFDAKALENKKLIDTIKDRAFTATALPAYDFYCGQTFLDNGLRGGVAVDLGTKKRSFVHYVYSRKHGDLERDYNRFFIEPAYFSQGDGNYRDINQNRRSDVWFEPKVRDQNIRAFLSLVQLDGFNPLIFKGSRFHFRPSASAQKALKRFLGARAFQALKDFFRQPFGLGELYRALEEKAGISQKRFSEFLGELGPYLASEERAEHGEGFWIDHWTYNLDLIENFLAVFPEDLERLLFEDKTYRFYDNEHRVEPRDKKYLFTPSRKVRQYRAVQKDAAKASLIKGRPTERNWVRSRQGRGEIYKTTLFTKLVCLVANKFSSLDAQGVGIEMEADKPGWYDALNGLPGLLGSSICETFELKRLIVFMLESLDQLREKVPAAVALPAELYDFVKTLRRAASWDRASSAREKYRQSVRLGLSGKEKSIRTQELKAFLELARERVESGLQKAWNPKTNLYPTYFINELPSPKKRTFHASALPLYLEGPVHAFKVEKDPARRRELYRGLRSSALYDRKLSMYKVCESLKNAPLEIGRACVFTPGWLEHESIWLHMEYKLLLELLKCGLVEEYFEDFKNALVCFQKPERYGRSILENSSFLVSSAFTDPSLHGGGFVARLSGSTAEFLSMWLAMNVGKRPFALGPDGKLVLRFEPQLPADFFTHEESTRVFTDREGKETRIRVPKNAVAFLFLGRTFVFYHNPKRLNTFGRQRVSAKKITLEISKGRKIEFKGDAVPSPYAQRVREGLVPRIDIELG